MLQKTGDTMTRQRKDVNKMTVAIKVENLSKKYIIHHEKKSGNYETFSEHLILGNKIKHPF